MRLPIKLIVILIMPLFMATSVHKFYVSVTKVEYKEEQKSLQFIMRVFIDDFEQLLRERYDENITLNIPNESKEVDVYSKKYITDKIIVKLNGESIDFNFLGKEYEDDIVYFYLEIENVAKINSLEITNKVLFDLFEEQQNIVRTKIYSKNKSFILIPTNDKGVLKFD